MRFRFLLPLAFPAVFLAEQPASLTREVREQEMSEMQHGHAHDGGFMQGGMHHAIAKGVVLDAKSDENTHTITLRVGPLHLPANTSHLKMPQPADLVWSIPKSGWLLAYHPKLVDASGNPVPGTVLHHVAFWNENRSDFLCPNKEEHIFGAGGELTDWALIPGVGYRVEKGDRIRIETMVHNPTSTAYDKTYLEVTIPYLDDQSPAPVKNVYPTWIDVGTCGNSGYDLQPGHSKKTGTVSVRFAGKLLGVGGHMHDYGQQLTLEISSADDSAIAAAKDQKSELARSAAARTGVRKPNDPVAVLPAKTDAQGHLLGIPVVTFFATGGYPLAAGDRLTVTSIYNNPTGKLLRDGAMGIVVGYFVPEDPAALDTLRHPAVRSRHAHDSDSHNMSRLRPRSELVFNPSRPDRTSLRNVGQNDQLSDLRLRSPVWRRFMVNTNRDQFLAVALPEYAPRADSLRALA